MSHFPKFTALLLVATLSAGGTALAQDRAPERSEKPAQNSAAPASEKIADKKHPDYVRCRSEAVIGSRAKRRKVCLTNREWAQVERDGSSVARRTVEEGRSGMIGE